MTGVLVELVVGRRPGVLDGVGRFPVAVLDGEPVEDGILVLEREPLDDALIVGRRGIAVEGEGHPVLFLEVRRLDEERVAFPPGHGVAGPRAVSGRRVAGRLARRVDRDDPRVVHPLDQDHQVGVSLHDRLQVVVELRVDRDRSLQREDAAVGDRQRLRVVVGSDFAVAPPGLPRVLQEEPVDALPAGLAAFGQRREAAVRRIDDQGRAVPAADLDGRGAAVHVEVVVAAHAGARRGRVAVRVAGPGGEIDPRRFLGADLFRLVLGEVEAFREGGAPFDRGQGADVVVAREVGLAARRPGNLVRHRGGRENGDQERRGEDSGAVSVAWEAHGPPVASAAICLSSKRAPRRVFPVA